ncbi:MAG TPA: cyclic nucleotide-binding domain-containing protein [Solirubrobacteraceae bacterium]
MPRRLEGARLVYDDPDGQAHGVALGGSARVTIGSGAEADVWLDWDMEASRLHAAVERLHDGWAIVDDGLSRGGTFVNGERVGARQRLRDGDAVRVGRTELVYRADASEAPDAPPAGPGAPGTTRLLAQVPLFAGLSARELGQVAEVAVSRDYVKGEAIFREGDRGDMCHVLRTGSVRLIRTHSDGRTITLAQLEPPGLLGELSMFGSDRRSATVEALEPTSTVAILAADLRRLLARRPELALRMLDEFAVRLRAANDHIAARSFQSVPGRVAGALLTRVQAGRGAGGGDEVVVRATHGELADLAGCSRESASRFLSTLERAGVVTCAQRRITVHRPDALRDYVD